MTVLLRVKRTQGAAAHGRAHGELGARARVALRAGRLVPAGRLGTESAATPTSSPARTGRRVGPATEDRALYTCSCGYVFSQDVSTSVSCPHCGGTQAW